MAEGTPEAGELRVFHLYVATTLRSLTSSTLRSACSSSGSQLTGTPFLVARSGKRRLGN